MSEEKIVITGPGKYRMRDGDVATVDMIVCGDHFPAKASNDGPGVSWMLNGRAEIAGERDEDIIARIPEPDAQDRIFGVKGITAKPTAMERFAAYRQKHSNDAVLLRLEPRATGQHGGNHVYQARVWRNTSNGLLITEANRWSDTPELALAAAMDVLEGLA